jgi:hypothetical protein
MRKRRGFSGNASPRCTFTPEGRAPAYCSLQSRWEAWYRSPTSTIGTLNVWDASAFTRENDLSRNQQTLFGYQCALEHCYDSTLTDTCQDGMIERMEKKRKSTTLRLTEQDIQAILKIRQYYGIASDNQAIILAIQFTARQIEGGTPAAAAFHPHS